MKKLYILSAFVVASFMGNAQSQVTLYEYDNGAQFGPAVNSDTIVMNLTSQEEWHSKIKLNYVGSADIRFRVKELVSSTCITDQLCPTLIPDPTFQGTCWVPNSLNYLSPQLTQVESVNTTFLMEPKGSVLCGGTAHYRYIIVFNGVETDSVDIFINSTLGIDDEEEIQVGMTAYPNPANAQLTINTKGKTGNYFVKITDVLGKVVYSDDAAEIKKIDVSNFKNGVYLISVMEEGKMIQTRRIVVKH